MTKFIYDKEKSVSVSIVRPNKSNKCLYVMNLFNNWLKLSVNLLLINNNDNSLMINSK